MRFRDRAEAGRQLAARLSHLRDAGPVVLALPRGGVPVGFEVAKALSAPLDLLVVRKLGAPGMPELAAGAVVDGAAQGVVRNEEVIRHFGITDAALEQEAARQRLEIARRRAAYLRGRLPLALTGRTAIVVDDGIATGATVRAALSALSGPAGARRVVLAAPVAAEAVAGEFRALCDEAVFLHTPRALRAVSAYYDDFDQTEDGEVVALLDRASAWMGASAADRAGEE
ncbi:phosphoribosyltransferase [Roseomonas populi]|uniref:Phosphoribosyltransferase family protein n=1 Tax=Roseomonas populi TaxID=3121582 RepID=A0ABT1X389_9PROT|nr:phosphoribosyltransferase family protein [Roseomonas pecuniae]MCR0982567.1 phosphoribosyltransferase family protein [Roseomonas pecuniae]